MQDTAPYSLANRLAPVLDPLQDRIKDMHWRVVSSAFNSSDPSLRALPLEREWRWPSLEAHLQSFKPQTLILQLPSFWQLEPYVHTAARAAEVPVCIIEPQNFPLDRAAIRLASAEAVLAEAAEAAGIAEYLSTSQVELPPYWILLHAANASQWDAPSLLLGRDIRVAQEVHLAPGVPLLVQCSDIVGAQSGYYHQSDLFAWSGDLSSPAISTNGSLLFEIKDLVLPFKLKDMGTCPCGKKLLARAS